MHRGLVPVRGGPMPSHACGCGGGLPPPYRLCPTQGHAVTHKGGRPVRILTPPTVSENFGESGGGGEGGSAAGIPGGGGSVGTPTYIPHNEPHDALFILNIDNWD